MKRTIATVLLTLMVVAAGSALASSIKSWSGGDVLTSADLNANFSHIHNTMVGGHGARLVNADVSASAAIAHSKLATPALVPKAFAYVTNGSDAACTTGTCTLESSSGVTSVVWNSTGVYTATIPARTDANYGVLVSAHGTDKYCTTGTFSTTAFVVDCRSYATTGGVVDAAFTVMLMDNDN